MTMTDHTICHLFACLCATALLLAGCTSPTPQAYQQCHDLTTRWCEAVSACDPTLAAQCASVTAERCETNRTVYAPVALDACRNALRSYTCTDEDIPVFANDPTARTCIAFVSAWRATDAEAFDDQ